MALLEDPTASQAFWGETPPPTSPEGGAGGGAGSVAAGGLLDDPTAGIAFNYTPDLGSGYVAAGGKSTYGDVLSAGAAGLHDMGATIASDLASHAYTPDATARWQAIAEDQRRVREQDIAGMTPAAQQDREGSFFAHPLIVGAEQAPALTALAAPAIIGGLVGGPIGAGVATIGTSALMGEQERGQAVDQFTADVMAKPDADLQQNPDYKALRDNGMSETDAKRSFAHSQSGNLAFQSEALGAGIGLVSPFAELGGGGIGKIAVSPLVNVALHGLEGATTMGVLSGGQTALTGTAEAGAKLRDPVTGEEIASSALSGAKFGLGAGLLGGVLGGGRGHGDTQIALHSEPKGGEANSTGSDRDGHKENVSGNAGKGPTPMTAKPGDSDSTTGPYSIEKGPQTKETPETTGAPAADPTAPRPPDKSAIVDPTQEAATNPEGKTPQEPLGASPAGQEAGGPSEPRPAPEPLVPEPAATLQEQHAALIDRTNPREAMRYPPGVDPIPITTRKADYGEVNLGDGSTVQFDRRGDNNLTKAKVRDFAQSDRLNELLQYGPESQNEVVQAAAEGRPTVAGVERAPNGTERKAAETTMERAPETVAAMKATKTPGSTVGVEPASAVAADRLKGVAREAQDAMAAHEAASDVGVGARDAATATAEMQEGARTPTVEDQLKATQAERLVQERAALTHGEELKAKRAAARQREAAGISEAVGQPAERPPSRRTVKLQEMAPGAPASTLREALRSGEGAHTEPEFAPLVRKIIERAGDVPVHSLSHAEITEAAGRQAHGLFDMDANHVLLNRDNPRRGTLLHEAFHAATAHGIAASRELQSLLGRLRDEVEAATGRSFGDAEDRSRGDEEFLTQMNTDRTLREQLKGVKISDQLGKDIDIAKWRKKTLWEGALNIFRRALGMGPREINVIDAAAHLGERAMDRGTELRARAPEPQFTPRVSERPAEAGLRFMAMGADPVRESSEEGYRQVARNVEPSLRARANDLWQRSKLDPNRFYRPAIKTLMTDTLRIYNEHHFGARDERNPMRRVQEGMERLGQSIRNLLAGHNELLSRVLEMRRSNPDGLGRLVSLLSEAADYGVHPDEALGVGRNAHIDTTRLDEKAPMEDHEGILAHERLADEYRRSTPEEQKLFRDMRDELMAEGKKNAEAHYKNFSDGLRQNFEQDGKLQAALAKKEADRLPSEIKQVERYNAISKVLNGDKLDGDEKEKFGSDPQIAALGKLRGLQERRGPFFPTTRKGEWVVNAEHEMPEAPRAISIKDNEFIFATRKDAFDYRKELVAQSLPSTMDIVREPISSEQMRGSGKDQYRVTVQNKHSSAVDSPHEGDKLAETLRQMKGIKKDSVTNPMLREKNERLDYGLHTGTLRALDHAVDALTHLSKDQRDALKEANAQGALGLMRGNRINAGLMERNRVRGANADPLLALHDYFSASARSRAQAEHMPDIDRALGEMRDTARNTQDADTWKRGILVNEMENRVSGFGKEGFTSNMPPWLHRLMSLAYVKFMMAPIHYLLDLTHPYLISIPQLAGRHGFIKSQVAFQKALSDMGGRTPALAKGLAGAWETAWEKGLHTPTDFIASTIDTLKKNGATDDEISAIRGAMTTGHLHSIILDFTPHLKQMGLGDRALRRTMNMGQEMSSAVDAINRIATYLAGYRLERVHLGDVPDAHVQAMRYAKDTVSQTQGLYTASNRASMMNNPLVRASMQFRQVPMMIYNVLGKNLYNTYKAEGAAAKWQALKPFIATMGTTAALGGATAGTPEPIRLAVMLTHLLGLTDGWQEQEDKLRKLAYDNLGDIGSRFAMDGVLGAAGLSSSSRIGLSDLAIKDDLSSVSAKDFLFDNIIGASGENATGLMSGAGDFLHGNFEKAIPALIPIRLVSDISKALIEGEYGKGTKAGTPGMPPLDPYEMFIRGMGGTPMKEALYNKAIGVMREEQQEQSAERTQIERLYTSGRKGAAISAMAQFNRANPSSPMKLSDLQRVGRPGPELFGQKLNPRNRAGLEERAAIYGQQ